MSLTWRGLCGAVSACVLCRETRTLALHESCAARGGSYPSTKPIPPRILGIVLWKIVFLQLDFNGDIAGVGREIGLHPEGRTGKPGFLAYCHLESQKVLD